MADTPKLTVSNDLAVVVNGDCGCFWKFYFELETDNAPCVDSEINLCKLHSNNRDESVLVTRRALYLKVSDLAKAEADRIRSKVNQ